MKKRLLALLLTVMTVLSCLLLTACNDSTVSFVGSKDAVKIETAALSSYSIVFPIRLDSDTTKIMEDFVNDFADKTGVRFTMRHDMKNAQANEILFADTSRDAYAGLEGITFRTRDFLLTVNNGSPVILAGSSAAYKSALDFILTACVGEDGTLWFPKRYHSVDDYNIDSLKIGSTLLTPDTFTIADYASQTGAADYLAEILESQYGYAFDVSRSASYKHIYVGRRLDTDNNATFLYELDADGNLYISAAETNQTINAVQLFLYHATGMIDTYSGATVKNVVFAPENDVLALALHDYNALKNLAISQRASAVLYVTASATGGGDGSEASPYTINEAFLRAVELADKDNINVTVNLAEGTYVLSETASIAAENMAKKNYSITIKGAGKDKTIVTSAAPIDQNDLVPVSGTDYYTYQLPSSLCDEDGNYPPIRNLLVNGEMMEMARTEGEAIMRYDAQKYKMQYNIETGYFTETKVLLDSADRVLYISDDLVQQLDLENMAGTEIWIKVEWQIHGLVVESIDMTKTKIDGDTIYYGAKIRDSDWLRLLGKAGEDRNYHATLYDRGYWLQNNIGLLTENTFVYHRETGTFYIMPQSDSDSFSVPLLDQLFYFKNLSNVTVEGIGFTGTTDTYISENGYITGQTGYQKDGGINGFLPFAAIYGENLSGIRIADCSFTEIGCDGVSLRGALSEAYIERNDFMNIGGSAIRIGNNVNYDDENYNNDIFIRHNYIDYTGVLFTSNVAIAVYHVNGLKLMNNTIKNSNYSAVSVGWSWSKANDRTMNVRNAEIACNYIEGFMLGMKDGGAIYVLGGNDSDQKTDLLNQMYENYCVVTEDTGLLAGKKTGGWTVLYHDGAASHWHTHHNVIYSLHDKNPTRFSYISHQTGGQHTYNNLCEFNFVIGTDEEYWILGGGFTGNSGTDEYGQTFRNNYVYKDNAAAEADDEIMSIILHSGCDGAHGILPAD